MLCSCIRPFILDCVKGTENSHTAYSEWHGNEANRCLE